MRLQTMTGLACLAALAATSPLHADEGEAQCGVQLIEISNGLRVRAATPAQPTGCTADHAATHDALAETKKAELTALLKQLADGNFRARKGARAKLAAAGCAAIALLEEHREHDDPEVAVTVRELLDSHTAADSAPGAAPAAALPAANQQIRIQFNANGQLQDRQLRTVEMRRAELAARKAKMQAEARARQAQAAARAEAEKAAAAAGDN
jgi:hypothetical protein